MMVTTRPPKLKYERAGDQQYQGATADDEGRYDEAEGEYYA